MPTAKYVFISYSHDDERHMSRVLDLANQLRDDGVDATLDQYFDSPPEGWPSWCLNQIQDSNFVLIVCTPDYYKRFRRRPGDRSSVGKGVTWEGAIVTLESYDTSAQNEKFLPVVYGESDRAYIPDFLRGYTVYNLQTSDGYDKLYRRLTGQPLVKMPPLGQTRHLPAKVPKKRFKPLARGSRGKQKQVRSETRKSAFQFDTARVKVLGGLGAALSAFQALVQDHKQVRAVVVCSDQIAEYLRRQYSDFFIGRRFELLILDDRGVAVGERIREVGSSGRRLGSDYDMRQAIRDKIRDLENIGGVSRRTITIRRYDIFPTMEVWIFDDDVMIVGLLRSDKPTLEQDFILVENGSPFFAWAKRYYDYIYDNSFEQMSRKKRHVKRRRGSNRSRQ